MGKEKVIFQQPKTQPSGRKGGAAIHGRPFTNTSSGPSPPSLQKKQNSDGPLKKSSEKKPAKKPQVPINVTPKDLMFKTDALQKGMRKGEEKFVEDQTKNAHEAQQKLDDLVTKTRKSVLRVKAVWPFDFFPDEILVDTEKVDIVNRTFFWSKQVKCVMLKNIFDVIVETSLIFATIRIIDKNYVEQESSIGFLWKHQAMRAKNVIQGLVTAVSEGIDLTKLETKDLMIKASKIGNTDRS